MKRIIYYSFLTCSIFLISFNKIKAQSDFNNYQITNSTYNPSETTIAMPPGDPSHLLVGANTIGKETFPTAGFYYSSDYGQNWSGSDEIETYGTADPTVAFSSNGNCYYCFKSGNFTYVVKSVNSYGTSWGTGNNFSQVSSTVSDKPFMFIDNMVNSPNKNNIYVAISDMSNPNSYQIRLSNAVSNSSDPNFSNNIVVSGNFDSHSACIAASPGGNIYVAWSIGNVLNSGSEFQTTGLGFNNITVSNGNLTLGSARQITTVSQIGTYSNYINRYVCNTGKTY